jgi:hypothetical protein
VREAERADLGLLDKITRAVGQLYIIGFSRFLHVTAPIMARAQLLDRKR